VKELVERYIHGISMKGLKVGAAVMPFRWPKTFEGDEPALELCRYMLRKGAREVLFVTSKTPVRTGLVKPLIDVLEKGGAHVTVFDGIQPDPTVEGIEAAVTVLKAHKCDAVLALGGGSCLDAAKVIAARGRNDKPILEMAGMLKITRGMLPLYVVPTTAGTGSEVTIAAVVTDAAGQRKLPLMDPRLMPRAAALDGSLMRGVPPDITAATGMDALTHAVEAYVSKNALPRTDKLAREATQLIMANLEAAVADGQNLAARQAMARASHLAGKAFTQAGVGYVHAIAHNFGALYHVPHGRANAIVMPYVLDYSLSACAKRLAELATACGIGNDGMTTTARAEAFNARIRAMNRQFRMPEKLAALKTEDVPRIAQAACREARYTYAVPRYMQRKTCEQVVRKMLVA
jgi:alcohol dehydrogenase class IV